MSIFESNPTKKQTKARESSRQLADKAKRVIDSASAKQKEVVERYMTLFNVRMHELTEQMWWVDSFGAAGASMGLKNRLESKFGRFIMRLRPARVIK